MLPPLLLNPPESSPTAQGEDFAVRGLLAQAGPPPGYPLSAYSDAWMGLTIGTQRSSIIPGNWTDGGWGLRG